MTAAFPDVEQSGRRDVRPPADRRDVRAADPSEILERLRSRWELAAVRLSLSSAATRVGGALLRLELDRSFRNQVLAGEAETTAPRRAHVLLAAREDLDAESALSGLQELEERGVVRSLTTAAWLATELELHPQVRAKCLRCDEEPRRGRERSLAVFPERTRRQFAEISGGNIAAAARVARALAMQRSHTQVSQPDLYRAIAGEFQKLGADAGGH